MTKYKNKDWYVISHTHNYTGYYLARFLDNKIEVVCNEYYFAKYCLENKGVSLNMSFGKALKEIYKLVKGKSFGKRPDEHIGIELYAHVYYYLVALGLEKKFLETRTRTGDIDGLVVYGKGLMYLGEKIAEKEWKKVLNLKDNNFIIGGIRETKKSTEIADLDLFGGNSDDVVKRFHHGAVERKALSTESFLKKIVLSSVGKPYSIKESEIDYVRTNTGKIEKYNPTWKK